MSVDSSLAFLIPILTIASLLFVISLQLSAIAADVTKQGEYLKTISAGCTLTPATDSNIGDVSVPEAVQ